ncbi:MAG: threonylcarbamoyl-AMP synthase [Candidatus Peribacteraceae bacterium]|nr:threonylcarbamoyl-AMP synthase [Candidatus Peribacteraceae bacterium]
MKVIKVNADNFTAAIDMAVKVFGQGGVVAHPTDTVWGLAADAENKQAIAKIHALKKSDPAKPMLLSLPSKSYLNRVGTKLCRAHKLIKEFWPGGLGLLVRSKKNPAEKVGVRLPAHKIPNALARKFGAPLVTTSANISGRKFARDAQAVAKIFPKVDLILDDGSISKNAASTLVDVSDKEVQLIRAGELDFKKVEQVLARRS